MKQSSRSNFVRGALYGLSAVNIWAAFIVVSRLGIRTSLTPWDVAAIRFGVAGLLLLPYLMRKGLALDRLGWIGLAAIAVGCGAPMALLVNAGLLFAPAAHGGALFPGVMPLMVAMLAAIILRETLTPQKNGGLVLIALGAIMIVWASGGTLGTRQNIGHFLFLCAGLAWAAYTVAMRQARLDGLHAAAIAAVASLVFYVPIYAAVSRGSLFRRPLLMWRSRPSCRVFDRHRRAAVVRAHGRHSRRDRRSGFRGTDAGHNSAPGYTGARRMAFCDRLDRDHRDLSRRVPPQRRATARGRTQKTS